MPLEYDGNKLNKVCKTCYLILTNQKGERSDGKKRRTLEASFLHVQLVDRQMQQTVSLAHAEAATCIFFRAPVLDRRLSPVL